MKQTLIASFILLSLGACGGGGGSSNSNVAAAASTAPPTTPAATNPASQPAPGADIIKGVITGFGSIFINGVRFHTSGADFSKDDSPASQDDLSIGMVVELRGSLADGTATSVRFDEDIKGPVDAISGNELTVLGQIVRLTPETVIDDSLNLNSLIVGDVLEISGLRGAGDILEATYVEDKAAANVNAFKVIGRVRDLDSNTTSFRVGGLTINYGTARLDDNLGPLSNDQLVEVKDDTKSYSAGDFTLIATKVESAGLGSNTSSPSTGTRIQVEGLITAISSNGFEIGDAMISHDAATLFVFGDATLLSQGTKVQVEGVQSANGGIEARKIKFARNSARVEGIVEGVNLPANTLTILGITIEPRPDAVFDDKRDNAGANELADISAGDFLEVRGNSTGERLYASEIRVDDTDDTRLRGPASAVDSDSRSLTILGVAIMTSANTQYQSFDDQALTAVEFFDRVQNGQTLIQAQWDDAVTDSSVAVRELSLEN